MKNKELQHNKQPRIEKSPRQVQAKKMQKLMSRALLYPFFQILGKADGVRFLAFIFVAKTLIMCSCSRFSAAVWF